MNSAEIRTKFLSFFESKGHTIVPSSALVPGNDPTLLLTNSGMVQFKDLFLGLDTRAYTRATSVQRCVRAGGKHNDLENVGYTARHHTFFEMLGNFSFGDYFKREAITYAWELLTKVYQLPVDKLTVTVYHEDDEAYNIWANEIGVPLERIIRIGDNKGARYASDNFWQMADVGPCGPCSEIFYDHGPDIFGGPPGSADEDGDRFIEIWNLVFMQFNRDEQGVMHPLPKPCVDTGMGLERLAAVLQHVHSNYEIDLFQKLIHAAARETGTANLESKSLRVIADHIRAASFLVVDGIIPSSEGHGYVLRRIIRRALRHGHMLGQAKPFFHKLVDTLDAQMGEAYPELRAARLQVAQTLLQEELRFSDTLGNGLKVLDAQLAKSPEKLDGATAFTLYDTYGFPLDLTADICRERGVELDETGFALAMDRQRKAARDAGKFKGATSVDYAGPKTAFIGYEHLVADATIQAMYSGGAPVQELNAGDEGVVVLDTTPFYAESGGQVGDRGVLRIGGAHFTVKDTVKIQPDVSGHHGIVAAGQLKIGDRVTADVDLVLRGRTTRNHSATHLMHKALRDVLGAHVQQKGSLVDADKTRFDFSHNAPLTQSQIAEVEIRVNQEIRENHPTHARRMSFDAALTHGAMALFGEKYGDEVRVLDIGTSKELCGGIHVTRTGDIGLFKIIAESGVAAGIRRVEAVTGDAALNVVQGAMRKLHEAASLLRVTPDELPAKIAGVQDQVRALERELTAMRATQAAGRSIELAAQAVQVKGLYVLAAHVENAEISDLRALMDKLKSQLQTAAIVLASVSSGRVVLIAGVTNNSIDRVPAGELVNFVAQQVGGKGGGRGDMAQAGGSNPAALPDALASVVGWITARI